MSTILIDPREGSGDILHYLNQIPGHPPTEHARLEAADVAFSGTLGTQPVTIGVEVKTLSDVLACITDQRFAGHQLPLLRDNYDIMYLAIEGEWRHNYQTGMLETRKMLRGASWIPEGAKRTPPVMKWLPVSTGKRQWLYHDFSAWLITMELCAGLRVKTVHDRNELVAWLLALYHWIQKEEHHAHLAMYTPPLLAEDGREPWVKPTLVQKIATQLPGVGFSRGLAVSKKFPSVEAMVAAGEGQWREIEGIGKTLSRRIVELLRGGNQ